MSKSTLRTRFSKPDFSLILVQNHHSSQSAIIANLHELGHIIKETKIDTLDTLRVTLWVDDAVLNRYLSKKGNQIIISEKTSEVVV